MFATATLRYNAASLPNPPRKLRLHNGCNKDLQREFFKDKRVVAFYERVVADALAYRCEHDDDDTELVVAIGCHAGRHRSVALVDRLSRDERFAAYQVATTHRDL